MKPEKLISELRVPLYKLYYLDSLDGFEFCPDEAQRAVDQYGAAHVARMVQALEWATRTDGIDWAEVLPNLPHDDAAIRVYTQTTASALMRALEAT